MYAGEKPFFARDKQPILTSAVVVLKASYRFLPTWDEQGDTCNDQKMEK
jgi:hypothetical protein